MYAGIGVLLIQCRHQLVDEGSAQAWRSVGVLFVHLMWCGWHIMHPSWPKYVLNKLNGYVLLKPRSVGSADMYLGIKLKFMQLHNGIWAWSISPSKHVWEAVRICKEYVARHLSKGYRLPKRADNPFKSDYCPELDVSPILGPDEESYYQFLIGVMR